MQESDLVRTAPDSGATLQISDMCITQGSLLAAAPCVPARWDGGKPAPAKRARHAASQGDWGLPSAGR